VIRCEEKTVIADIDQSEHEEADGDHRHNDDQHEDAR